MYRNIRFNYRLSNSVGHLVQFIKSLNPTKSLFIFSCEASSHLVRKHVPSDEEEILIAEATFKNADFGPNILS